MILKNCEKSITRNKISLSNNGPLDSEEARGIIPDTSADQTSNSSVGNLNAIALIASISKAPIPLATVSNMFTAESVWPLPRAPPRKNKVPTDVESNLLSLLTKMTLLL